jgi:hypothetical protein
MILTSSIISLIDFQVLLKPNLNLTLKAQHTVKHKTNYSLQTEIKLIELGRKSFKYIINF